MREVLVEQLMEKEKMASRLVKASNKLKARTASSSR
jgi:hypothetical protein